MLNTMLKLQALLRPVYNRALAYRSVSTFPLPPLKCSLARSGENEIVVTKGILRGIISELQDDMPRALSVCVYACIAWYVHVYVYIYTHAVYVQNQIVDFYMHACTGSWPFNACP